MDEVKKQLNKEIPEEPSMSGVYDEEEERWIKFPKMEMNKISSFVREAVREIDRIKETFGIERVSFEMRVKGNVIKFTIKI